MRGVGRLVENRQKGVDSLTVRDLITLGVERAIVTAYLVGGDEDLREGVAEAQGMGVRVVLVGVGGGRPNQSLSLIGEVDENVVLGRRFWAPHFQPAAAAEVGVSPAQPGPDTDVAEVGVRLATEWSVTASQAQLHEVLSHHPRVPAALDRWLVRSAEEALGSLRGRPELKAELREGFWLQLRGGLLVGGGGGCG